MDFDPTYTHGQHVDWNFPSPSATPTSATFNSNSNPCQTPKASTTFPSHFNDAFGTPQMQGFATPTQPEQATVSQMHRPQVSTEAQKAQYLAHVHATGGRAPGQEQYNTLHNLGSFSAPDATPTLPGNVPSMPQQQVAMPFLDPSHMQTPPPTRGTSTKDNSDASTQPIAFGTPSTIASRRVMSPQHQAVLHPSSTAAQHTPMQYPQMLYPPELYQFSNVDPVSAPVFPQSQILWTSPNTYQPSNALEDQYAPYMQGEMLWPSTTPMPGSHIPAVNFATPEMKSFPTQASHPRLAAPIQVMPPATTSGSVNPSLVYCSPVRPVDPPKTRPVKTRNRASQEELRPKSASTTDHARSETISSTGSFTSTSSRGLRRNNTTGTAELLKAQSSLRSSEPAARSAASHIPRTASPLKRIGQPALGPIDETRKLRTRRSVVLTVDEHGRARAETRMVDESPTRLARERYPGLYAHELSDTESDGSEEPPLMSQNSSFNFAPGEERKPKLARLEQPLESLVGFSIPRSSSAASVKVSPSRAAIAAAAQLRRDGSVRKKSSSKRRPGMTSANTSFDASALDLAPAVNSTADVSRGRRLSTAPSFEQLQPQMSTSSNSAAFSFEVPHSRRPSFYQERLVRCSCGASIDNGTPLIQCYSCTKWLHPGCAGFGPNTALPRKFTCSFCSVPNSNSRAGKNRRR